jgi:hypothetical protein
MKVLSQHSFGVWTAKEVKAKHSLGGRAQWSFNATADAVVAS